MSKFLQSSLSGKERQQAPLILDQALSEGRDGESPTEPEESKGLVSHVRHDLRNSLNVVMGFADLLSAQATGTLNEKQQLYVHNIQAGTRRMLRLLNSKEDEVPSEASSEPSGSLGKTAQI